MTPCKPSPVVSFKGIPRFIPKTVGHSLLKDGSHQAPHIGISISHLPGTNSAVVNSETKEVLSTGTSFRGHSIAFSALRHPKRLLEQNGGTRGGEEHHPKEITTKETT